MLKFHSNKLKSWNSSWEKVFQKREWGKYPPEELVRFIGRSFYNVKSRNKIKILDLGCGPGACSWYLAREGFSVYGIDGSKTAIQNAKKRLRNEHLHGEFKVMDFIKLDFPDKTFDVVIDIDAIQHNSLKNVPKILSAINRVLKSNGKLFSILVGNGTTKSDLFKNKGFIHYYTLEEIKKKFCIFDILSIDKSMRTEKNRKEKIFQWVVLCQRNG